MSTVCFLDNDIILKLVACNLFYDAIETINVSQSDLRVLARAKFYFKNSKRAKKHYPEEIRLKATGIANRCQTVNQNTEEAINELAILQQYEGIDDGEALLVAATREEKSFCLTTGDKRFLRTLANTPELTSISSRLHGRVVCLEQIIYKLINTEGFEKTLGNILPARQYDTALKSVFGSGEKATENNVLNSLENYIQDLRKETGKLLTDSFE